MLRLSTTGTRTKHATLLLDESTEVAEDLVEFVNAAFDLPDLGFTLLDKGLLERELLGRQLGLEDLRLTLRWCRTCSSSLFLSTDGSQQCT